MVKVNPYVKCKKAGDDLSFVIWCVLLLEVSIRRWFAVVMKVCTWSVTIHRYTGDDSQSSVIVA